MKLSTLPKWKSKRIKFKQESSSLITSLKLEYLKKLGYIKLETKLSFFHSLMKLLSLEETSLSSWSGIMSP